MPKTNHIPPGPYTIEDSPEFSDIGIEKDGAILATVFNADSFPCADDSQLNEIDAQARALAHLFAAAPDLLATLERIQEMSADDIGNGRVSVLYSSVYQINADARAAIALAKGEA